MAYPTRTRPSRGGSSTPMAPPSHKAAAPAYSPYPSSPAARAALPTSNTASRPQVVAATPPRVQIYHHPETYASGPLPFFLAPPGQRTLDPTLSTPPTTQAFYSTYPSRMRTGVTGLVQPETITGGPREREHFLAELDRELASARSSGTSTPRVDSPAPKTGRTVTTTLSGRRAGRINYAEKSEDEEESESSEEEVVEGASDPEDTSFGGRNRGGKRDQAPPIDHGATIRIGRMKKKHTELERGWTWLGDRVPGERVRSSFAKVTKHKYIPEEILEKEADRPELLVPITIDFDVPSPTGEQLGIKIKDRFLWNANEPFYKPLEFATVFCDDLGIPSHHANTLAELIQAQVEEAQNTVVIDLADVDVTPDDVNWSDEETEQAMEVDDDGEENWVEPDCRIIVNLDVQLYTYVLRDRIEWDLSSSLPPSLFAKHYCAELGLTGEAIPLIAHAIHEELIKHKRDALELDLFARTHPHEQAKWEKATMGGQRGSKAHGAKALVGVWRDWWERDEYGPMLVELSTEEMERRDVERNREARRMMRTLATAKRRR